MTKDTEGGAPYVFTYFPGSHPAEPIEEAAVDVNGHIAVLSEMLAEYERSYDKAIGHSLERAALTAAIAALRQQAVPDGWQPIETAPKDNKRPLLIATFNADNGNLTSFDYNAQWASESESWEIPRVYYFWESENGHVDEPTHWMYQPDWFAAVPA